LRLLRPAPSGRVFMLASISRIRSMLPSWLLLVMILIGGALAVGGTTLYPGAREREAKERLARDARAILLPEIEANIDIASKMQARLAEGKVPSFTLNVAAWQTISGGGLLIGLKSEEINRFLHIYGLIFEVNTIWERLLDLSRGANLAPETSSETRLYFAKELRGKLSDLQEVFKSRGAAVTPAN
jgi:hypothetical protein